MIFFWVVVFPLLLIVLSLVLLARESEKAGW